MLDFGISKIIVARDPQHTLSTRAGAVIGTPHYMSLEQLRSVAVVSRYEAMHSSLLDLGLDQSEHRAAPG